MLKVYFICSCSMSPVLWCICDCDSHDLYISQISRVRCCRISSLLCPTFFLCARIFLSRQRSVPDDMTCAPITRGQSHRSLLCDGASFITADCWLSSRLLDPSCCCQSLVHCLSSNFIQLTQHVRLFTFLQRAQLHFKRCIIATAIPSVCLSVCPSVCHTPVLCQNDGT